MSSAMTTFFSSGHAIDVVLAVLAVEAVYLRRSGVDFMAIASALLPAVLMMLALRAALTGWSWPFVAGPLALAFPVHMIDLWRQGWLDRRA
jgi:hypothetical protein